MSEERGFDYNQLIGPGIGAGAAFLGSIPQMVEARRLKKERERLLKEGAPGMTAIEDAQIAAARARAASGLAPGYAQEMENNAELTSNLLGAGKKAGITGSNAMNLLSRLNQQGQAARRNLAARGAQAQRAAQGDYANISMTADARRQGRVDTWENRLANMDAKRREYNAAVGMAPLQGAISFMPVEGFKSGTGALKTPKPDNTMPTEGTPMTFGENLDYQAQYNQPPPVDPKAPMNTPLVPPGVTPTFTGLEREPSMMAAPQYGKTKKEYLIRNPLKNTTNPRVNNMVMRQIYVPPASNDVAPFMIPAEEPETNMMGRGVRMSPYYNFNSK